MKAIVRKFSRFDEVMPCAIAVRTDEGEVVTLGRGTPVLSVHVKNTRGRRALLSLNQLDICDAYIRGDLDFEGDLIEALAIRDLLRDRHLRIKLWRRLKPLLVGGERCPP